MAPYKILKQGYMLKEPPVSKRGIRKRVLRYWFVLVEDRTQVALVYFKTEDAYIARNRNEGFIRVDEATNISVVGEHMGHKNAFVVKTPKGEFHLLPESRYDLHEWLFTLHNSMESFKKRLQRVKERQRSEQHLEERGVQHGLDQRDPRPNGANKERTKSSSTTTTPPSRRAPLPPQERAQWRSEDGTMASVSASGGGSPRRKPVRPAPIAPNGGRTHSISSVGTGLYQDEPLSPNCFGNEITTATLHPHYSSYPPHTGTFSQEYGNSQGYGMESDRGGYNSMESGQHMIVDMGITEMHGEQEAIDVACPRSNESSSLVPLQKMSSSLPELTDENADSSIHANHEAQAEEGKQSTNRGGFPNNDCSHTRHLSLMGGIKKDGSGVRQSGRRKLRSRSPPNLPPPPPPPSDPMERLPEASQDQDAQKSVGNGYASVGTTSPGYSEVLNTISSIDQQLDNITENFTTSTVIKVSHPPRHPPPLPPTERNTAIGNHTPDLEQHSEIDGFREEDWMCDLPLSPTDPLGSSSKSHDKIAPDQIIPMLPPRTDVTSDLAEQNSAKTQQHVMFKDDKETVPSYEPCVDQRRNKGTETPVGVAAIKMQLFGNREKEATRYKKDGVLSPKNTHFANMSFSDDYFSNHSEPSGGIITLDNANITLDNANNNNSEGESAVVSEVTVSSSTGRKDHDGDKAMGEVTLPTSAEKEVDEARKKPPRSNPKHNVYESPWDEKSISKFKEIGVMRKTKSPPTAQEQVKGTARDKKLTRDEKATSKDKKLTRDEKATSKDKKLTRDEKATSKDKKPTRDEKSTSKDKKPTRDEKSKFKGIGGGMRKTKSPPTAQQEVKETAPPVAAKQRNSIVQCIQFAEVSVKETPRPFSTEVRNVLSLERKKKEVISLSASSTPTHLTLPSPGMCLSLLHDKDSLLASISDTLQATSLYGSDTLLNKGEVSPNSPGNGSEKATPSIALEARTTRGELEKIRASYRKGPTTSDLSTFSSYSPASIPTSPHAQRNTTDQYSTSPASAVSSTVNSSPSNSDATATGRAKQHHNGILTASKVDVSRSALPANDTHITFDMETQGHILRSLV